jgi:hypothetical protein
MPQQQQQQQQHNNNNNNNNNNNMKITNEFWTHSVKVVSFCIKSHQHN